MHFIGIGLRKTTQINFDLIRDQAAQYDLLLSKTIGEGHFREGLSDFSSHLDLSLYQCSAFNEDDKRASSRQISDDLMTFYRYSGETGLLSFLDSETSALPGSFYLLFAGDWNKAAPVRFEKLKLKDLKDYFRRNNSWYQWLYNYSAGSYYPQLNLPLILEITSD